MRRAFAGTVSGAILLASTGIAGAASISTTTKTYAISGQSGHSLLQSMNKRGPKHGWLSRAIAQTQYVTSWEVRTRVENGSCRLVQATPSMKMVYTYPQPSDGLSADLRKRWATFMVGVRRHEEQHGRYALQMLKAAERSVRGLKVAKDPNCRKANAEIKRRVSAVYAEYEAKQIVFDQREHRENGNIHRLIKALVRE